MKARSVAPLTTIGAGRRLSEGAVAQASIRARLLGIPLLRLDASVVLLPAAGPESSAVAIPVGEGLVEAARSLDHASEILDHVQHDNGRR